MKVPPLLEQDTQQPDISYEKPGKLSVVDRIKAIPVPSKRHLAIGTFCLLSFGAIAALIGMAKSLSGEQGQVATPAAEVIQAQAQANSREALLAEAGAIIRQEPFPINEPGTYTILGQEVFISGDRISQNGAFITVDTNPALALTAANLILDQQESLILQLRTAELYNRMMLGLSDPSHVCYQKPLLDGEGSCLAILERGTDTLLSEGRSQNDIDKIVIANHVKEAFGRIKAGNVSFPSELELDTLRLAHTIRDLAQERLRQQSPNGRSQAMLGALGNE